MATGIRIRVLEGATCDGRTDYEFVAAPEIPEQSIVIGRDPQRCHIAFVDSLREKGLGNEHLALRRSLGRYQLDLNTQNAVFVDGKRAFEEQELVGTSTLRLGDAVTLQVDVVDDRPATVVQANRRPQEQQLAAGTRRMLAALAMLVGGIAVAGWLWKTRDDRREDDARAEVLAEATRARREAEAARAGVAELDRSSPVSDAVIARVKESVYAVVLRSADKGETLVGTAWSAPGNVVATNFHVAVPGEDEQAVLDEGGEYLVRSSVPPYRTHRIEGAMLHPGFRRFGEMTAGFRPLQKSAAGLRPVEFTNACDVAILKVEDSELLAPPLAIAPREELRSLRAGQPIAMVGYPEESLLIRNVVARPEPLAQKASIVRVTDFFSERRDDGNDMLVQHSLPVVGGASGSPVVDGRGLVVAIITAINPIMIPTTKEDGTPGGQDFRIMNPAAVNFAQRADFILDLLENRADEALARYEADWERSMSRLDRVSDEMIPVRRRQLSQLLGREVVPRVIREFTARAERAVPKETFTRAGRDAIDLPRGVFNVVAVPARSVDLDVALVEGETPLVETVDNSPLFHGDILLCNRFERRVTLAGWLPPEGDTDEIDYKVTVIDWGIDPEEFIEHRGAGLAERAVGGKEPPAQTADLEPVRLDAKAEIVEGETVPAGRAEWAVEDGGLCLVTCRPRRPAQIQLHMRRGGRLVPISPLAENPVAIVPCDGKATPVTVLIVAPLGDSKNEPIEVDVRVAAWRMGPEDLTRRRAD